MTNLRALTFCVVVGWIGVILGAFEASAIAFAGAAIFAWATVLERRKERR
ncbi:MAG: hypothetical protein NTW96_26740 [Planctomycetia bacterium]|nr:hypothetical protein [Planctomycetia bacterium]